MTVYVTEQGAKITLEAGRLVAHTSAGPKILYDGSYERLVLFGQIHLTTAAIHLLLRQNIDTIFLTSSGKFLGRLAGAEGENVELARKQFVRCADPRFCLMLARGMIQGKIKHQRMFLKSRLAENSGIGRNLDELDALMGEVPRAADIDRLRGMEGAASALYFRNFRHLLHDDWGFVHRERRPPKDPVNAMLSFFYTLLASRMHSAIRITGLDPRPGCMHTDCYGRAALPLDLMEEFRVFAVDRLVARLFNQKRLGMDHFEHREDEAGEKGLYLTPEALKAMLAVFEEEMGHPVKYRSGSRPLFEAMRGQAEHYRELVEKGEGEYQPFSHHYQ